MNKFVLDCDALESIKTEINKLIGEIDNSTNSVRNYDLVATDFDFEEAKNSILSNLNYIKEKITNTVILFEKVTGAHTDLQNALKIEYQKQESNKQIDVNSISTNKTKNNELSTIEYIIKKGDTLSAIACAAGVSVKELQELNNIKNANIIITGKKLIIPNKTRSKLQTQSNNIKQDTVTLNDLSTNTQANYVASKTSTNNQTAISDKTMKASSTKYKTKGNFIVTDNNKKYILNNEDYDLLCAIVAAESDKTPDDALAVASVILNRCESQAWINSHGTNPIKQATAPNQFVVYQNGLYKAYLGGKCNTNVKIAVSDALNGIRNNKFLSFRSNNSTSYQGEMITSSGNRYK